MLDNIFWLLEHVRTEILEAFKIPDLNISYWEFLIYSAIVLVVVTVLINAVQVSSGSAVREGRQRKEKAQRRQRFRN